MRSLIRVVFGKTLAGGWALEFVCSPGCPSLSMALTFLLPSEQGDQARASCRGWSEGFRMQPNSDRRGNPNLNFFIPSVPLHSPTGLLAEAVTYGAGSPCLAWGYLVSLMHRNLLLWDSIFSRADPTGYMSLILTVSLRWSESWLSHKWSSVRWSHIPNYTEARRAQTQGREVLKSLGYKPSCFPKWSW